MFFYYVLHSIQYKYACNFFFRKLFIKAVTFKDYVIAIQKEFVWHCPSDMHIFIAKIKMSEGQYDTFHLEIYVQKKSSSSTTPIFKMLIKTKYLLYKRK